MALSTSMGELDTAFILYSLDSPEQSPLDTRSSEKSQRRLEIEFMVQKMREIFHNQPSIPQCKIMEETALAMQAEFPQTTLIQGSSIRVTLRRMLDPHKISEYLEHSNDYRISSYISSHSLEVFKLIRDNEELPSHKKIPTVKRNQHSIWDKQSVKSLVSFGKNYLNKEPKTSKKWLWISEQMNTIHKDRTYNNRACKNKLTAILNSSGLEFADLANLPPDFKLKAMHKTCYVIQTDT